MEITDTAKQRLSKLAVLLVEDELHMRKIVKTVLTSMGFASKNIFEAVHGREAIDILEDRDRTRIQPIRLIVSDMVMPEVNGLELLAGVKNNVLWQTIPFIMLTSQNDEESVVGAIELGVSDYLTKPFKPEHLEQKVKALLKVRY